MKRKNKTIPIYIRGIDYGERYYFAYVRGGKIYIGKPKSKVKKWLQRAIHHIRRKGTYS